MVLGCEHRLELLHRAAGSVTLRVVHCIYDSPGNPWVAGGGAVRLHELYRRLEGQVDVTVITGNFPGARDETVDGVPYRRLGARSPYAWSRLSYARAASRLLRNEPYDVAVFDFSVYTPLRIPVGRPIGLTVHHLTGPTARERWGGTLGGAVAAAEAKSLRKAKCISVTSRVTEAQVRAIVGSGIPLVPVAAGVSDDLFELPRNEQDYLLYFGRLDFFQKGIDTLLRGMALIASRNPAVELRVAGRGKDLERARALAGELGISDRVRFLGPVSENERKDLFAGALVLLMPSRFEGFGMVAAEAMAAGVPLVAAAAGALPEVVAAPSGGVLVEPEDPAALAAAVERLMLDEDGRRKLSRTARISAQRFRWAEVARQHMLFLDRIRTG
ncbi:MAG: glycosyltransferase family 4 protein [Gemmatimonadetes bacterium]|nr:glycosyltransferase family 4 protein [Gemmatimonadota bacterium]